MSETTTIRVRRSTRDALNELASARGEPVTDTVDRALRLLRQDSIGQELSAPLADDEIAWLDATAG